MSKQNLESFLMSPECQIDARMLLTSKMSSEAIFVRKHIIFMMNQSMPRVESFFL